MVSMKVTMADLIDPMERRQLAFVRATRSFTRAPARLASLIKLDDVASHRSLSCSSYDACLSEALLRGWPSWTCRSCSQFALRDNLRALEVAHGAARRIDSDSDPYPLSSSARQAGFARLGS
jgi:hypothetical protein